MLMSLQLTVAMHDYFKDLLDEMEESANDRIVLEHKGVVASSQCERDSAD